ncbi:photosynthetic NDH subunit of subcomplex B 3, chloroplastic [Mangifera indica]|uniref:photosynthetic NDH subunit of subcomplex B 3, chloroplastic n=1 Tax=Mangifera indica TaxID=29780 RepID=UPI001CFB5B08|nr:photosynthetic NDH subunit of subcomplex B 3, chloroplastic [Mangifera indica]
MESLQLNTYRLPSHSVPCNLHYNSNHCKNLKFSRHYGFSRGKIRATATIPDSDSQSNANEGPPVVNFAFVHSVLLPDCTPDVHFRTARGGQKLRNIMLDGNIDLYGPYARPLLNCGGGGTCCTCMVEVIQGKELLSQKTDKEKEKLKRQPKNWRLACQTTVGTPESTGLVVIQQLPEWKGHEWKYKKVFPPELSE